MRTTTSRRIVLVAVFAVLLAGIWAAVPMHAPGQVEKKEEKTEASRKVEETKKTDRVPNAFVTANPGMLTSNRPMAVFTKNDGGVTLKEIRVVTLGNRSFRAGREVDEGKLFRPNAPGMLVFVPVDDITKMFEVDVPAR